MIIKLKIFTLYLEVRDLALLLHEEKIKFVDKSNGGICR
jgi:hypothetical protein